MKGKILLAFLLIIISGVLYGQKKGMLMHSPTDNVKILFRPYSIRHKGYLKEGEVVKFLSKTLKKYKVTIDGKKISTQFYLIETKKGVTGYVPEGVLKPGKPTGAFAEKIQRRKAKAHQDFLKKGRKTIFIFFLIYLIMIRIIYIIKLKKRILVSVFSSFLLNLIYVSYIHQYLKDQQFMKYLMKDIPVVASFFVGFFSMAIFLNLGVRMIEIISYYIMKKRLKSGKFNKTRLNWLTRIKIRRIKEKIKRGDLKKINPQQKNSLTNELRSKMKSSYQTSWTILKLIEKGADFNSLLTLISKDRYYLGKNQLILLELGANVNVKGEYGKTPLMVAAEELPVRVLHAMLRAGADPKTKDSEGNTALMNYVKNVTFTFCFFEEAKKQMTLLKVCDLNTQDNEGRSLLINALYNIHSEIVVYTVKWLIKIGAPLNAKDNEGRTALDHAYLRANNKIIKILRKAGVREGSGR